MGCVEWKSGRVEEWKSGRVEEWKSGRVEEWKSGRVEEWKSGRVEEWKKSGSLHPGEAHGAHKSRCAAQRARLRYEEKIGPLNLGMMVCQRRLKS